MQSCIALRNLEDISFSKGDGGSEDAIFFLPEIEVVLDCWIKGSYRNSETENIWHLVKNLKYGKYLKNIP